MNEKKTKLLTISNNRYKTDAWLETPDGELVQSEEELKLLGFIFSDKPNCNKQIKYILKRASARFYVLRYYSKFTPGDELRTLYCALVRSVLE